MTRNSWHKDLVFLHQNFPGFKWGKKSIKYLVSGTFNDFSSFLPRPSSFKDMKKNRKKVFLQNTYRKVLTAIIKIQSTNEYKTHLISACNGFLNHQ